MKEKKIVFEVETFQKFFVMHYGVAGQPKTYRQIVFPYPEDRDWFEVLIRNFPLTVPFKVEEEEAYWVEKADTNCMLSIFECSKCKGEVAGSPFTFCPHCGRKMIAGKIENNPVQLVNEKTTNDYFPKVSDKEIPYSVERGWNETLMYERNHDLDSGN